MMKIVAVVIFLLGLWYIVLPMPEFYKFPGISMKPLNTQLKELTVTYTNHRRNSATDFYKNEFQKINCKDIKFLNPFCYIKPFKINHSTSLASVFVAPKQLSTYLEEYYYPLRGSVIINGYEPYDEKGKAFDKYSETLLFEGKSYNSIITVKYTGSALWSRLLIYLLIWICIFWIGLLIKRIKYKTL